jgi:hypothetical protein
MLLRSMAARGPFQDLFLPSLCAGSLSSGSSNQMNKRKTTDYRAGDHVAFAMPAGLHYGTVVRVLGQGESTAVEIEFEDGRKEIKKARDRALSLLRRASGASEVEERQGDRTRLRDPDVERVRRSEMRRRS